MSTTDYLILGVYLVGIAVIGLRYSSQKGLREYFLGNRSISWFVSLATLIANGISANTFIGIPALSFAKDLTGLQLYMGMPVAALLAAWFVVPFFYRQDIITAYEYLEKRFDIRTRLLACLFSQLLMILLLGTVVQAPAKVLSEISGLSYTWSVLIVGLATIGYTVVGGYRAVVWTDTIQLLLMIVGPLVAVTILILHTDGGFARIVSIASEHQKLRLVDTSFNLQNEVTIWSGLTALTIYHFSALVVSQENVQKYLGARSIQDSRKAVVLHGFGLLVVWTLFFLIGVALFAFHTIYPERLPADNDGDRIFVRFIVNELPMGLRGLVLSSIFAAASSNISATLNSLSSVTVVDIWQRFFASRVRGKEVIVARWTTLGWGLLSLVSALVVARWGGIVITGLRVGTFISGPLLGIFLLGMFTNRANGIGVFSGSIAGMIVVALVGQFAGISWVWNALVGAVASILFGYLLSLPFPAPATQNVDGLTLVKRRKGMLSSEKH